MGQNRLRRQSRRPHPHPHPEAIVLGKVSKPAEKIEEYRPLADYLTANLGDFVAAGEVKVAPDPETMAGWMEGDDGVKRQS